MLTSLALIFLLGLLLGSIFQKLKLPGLLGMILTGILLGPHALNLLDGSILSISADLRRLALVIILTRAGLSLNLTDLKKVGRPAFFMCFIPATFEIIGVVILGTTLLNLSLVEALLAGTVLAAVSPAIVVPRMIRLMEQGYGVHKSIPQMILAGASADDVYVIVLFTAFTTLAQGGEFKAWSLMEVPVSILLGLLIGVLTAWGLVRFFKKFHMRDTVKIMIILSVSFLFLELENIVKPYVPVSGLLAIMALGIMVNRSYSTLASRLSVKYNKLWVTAEVLLFVLVGAEVNIVYAKQAGILVVVVILLAMVFRMLGVFISLLRTTLNLRERLFCMLAYTPKATVQAAIGAIPLSLNLASGNMILTLAVVSILLTAPFGAICMDRTYKILLAKSNAK
jgi:solute carrier family 9B (sodium/hydrogen exchanger), member 1/2